MEDEFVGVQQFRRDIDCAAVRTIGAEAVPAARGERAEFRRSWVEVELIPREVFGGALWDREMFWLTIWRLDRALLAVGGAADEGDDALGGEGQS